LNLYNITEEHYDKEINGKSYEFTLDNYNSEKSLSIMDARGFADAVPIYRELYKLI